MTPREELKPPNRKGVRHWSYCLHDEPGVTVCTCDPRVDWEPPSDARMTREERNWELRDSVDGEGGV